MSLGVLGVTANQAIFFNASLQYQSIPINCVNQSILVAEIVANV